MTTKVQAATLLLEARADAGVTWKELATVEQWGHGSCSRVLSDLHRTGKAERLTERREGCAVYVLPSYAGTRETEPHGRLTLTDQALAAHIGDARKQADAVEEVIRRWGLDGSRFPTMQALAADLRSAVGRSQPTDPSTLPI